jgi:hypothetical protein
MDMMIGFAGEAADVAKPIPSSELVIKGYVVSNNQGDH